MYFNKPGFSQTDTTKLIDPLAEERNDTVKKIARKPFNKAENFGDIIGSDRMLMGQNKISGNVFYLFGRTRIDDCPEPRNEYRNSLGVYTRIAVYKDYSINTNFYKEFNKKAIQPWASDFTYSYGKLTFADREFSYGYENYIDNKYKDSWETLKEKYLLGYYFISYGYNLPEKIILPIKADSTTNLRINAFVRYSLAYEDEFDNFHFEWYKGKPIFGISVRYTILKNIFLDTSYLFYLRLKTPRLPTDPDFTYSFGYYDYRPFKFFITYGNWVLNRFPWNTDENSIKHGLRDGDFKLVFNYAW